MALILADRVKDTTTTTGTGAITLAGSPPTGYRAFGSVMASGDATYYCIDDGAGNWEVGVGTFTASVTLSRDIVLSSSNAGALVNFGAGTKTVFLTVPAAEVQTIGLDLATALGWNIN